MLAIPNTTNTHMERQSPALPLEAAAVEPLILVVEDDWSIRRFLCQVLRFAIEARIIEVSDPDAALSLARKTKRIDLLVSDIDLSADKSGIDLARELSAKNPSMKVLLMSAADCPQFEIPPGWRFLAKPFPMEIFLDCLNALCRPLLEFKTPAQIVRKQSAA